MFYRNTLKKLKREGNILLRSQFLNSLSPLQRVEFLRFCHRRTYTEGEYIYYQNDPATGMYFIESGRVQLIIEKGSEEEEKKVITRELSPPESFGLLSIGYELRRTSSARSLTDCVLLGFFKPDFDSLKWRHPQIAVKFLEGVTGLVLKQLDRSTRKLIEVSGAETAFAIQNGSRYGSEE